MVGDFTDFLKQNELISMQISGLLRDKKKCRFYNKNDQNKNNLNLSV